MFEWMEPVLRAVGDHGVLYLRSRPAAAHSPEAMDLSVTLVAVGEDDNSVATFGSGHPKYWI